MSVTLPVYPSGNTKNWFTDMVIYNWVFLLLAISGAAFAIFMDSFMFELAAVILTMISCVLFMVDFNTDHDTY